ncbi:hypothetical protein [Clostridium sp. YIM B02555]|uniref:hypothetical protein n=1 Tax=Clostridium sp. YIM B02555 TaxID=2911968 RepID=UPI001EEE0B8E|nr:hypothetical protein [Clostridium sp. YIM B02555]
MIKKAAMLQPRSFNKKSSYAHLKRAAMLQYGTYLQPRSIKKKQLCTSEKSGFATIRTYKKSGYATIRNLYKKSGYATIRNLYKKSGYATINNVPATKK